MKSTHHPHHPADFNNAYERALSAWPVPYHCIFVPTRFGETHVLSCGDPDAPPLVLLPGNFSSAVSWRHNIASLSQSLHVLAVDVPGEPGRSAMERAPATREDYALWLLDVLDGLNLPAASLAGISKGGFLAANFALRFPARVRKLALLCPGLPLAQPTLQWLIRGAPMVLRPTPSTVGWFLDGASTRKDVSDPAREAFVAGMTSLHLKAVPPPDMDLAELKQLSMPVLLLIGQHEILYSTQAAIRRARQTIPNLQAEIIPGAGHFIHSDQPDEVNRFILEFLTRRDDE
jgi:pimeloyl-ACP methyl ester carboxylesterase